MVKRTLVLLFVAACGTFEDPAVVLDLRPVAVEADVPEQVVTVDLTRPVTADEVLVQLVDANVKVWLSDRNFDRNIRWSAELCNMTDALRCDHASPYEELGSGVWPDPDDVLAQPPTIEVPADGNLLGILLDELDHDTLHGLGGLTYGVSLKFGGEDADPALDQYAAKALMVSPAIPAGRTPNHNPTIDHIDVTTGVDVDPETRPLPPQGGLCGDGTEFAETPATTELRLEPIETPTTRETYTVPTIDGMTRTFTEAVTYQWLATAGKFSSTNTGGGHDTFGNLMPVHTVWTAPAAKDLDASGDVQMWIIQRDERLGVAVYTACVHVTR